MHYFYDKSKMFMSLTLITHREIFAPIFWSLLPSFALSASEIKTRRTPILIFFTHKCVWANARLGQTISKSK